MTPTMTYTGSLVITSCWCGIHVAIPQDLYNEATRIKKAVFCPLGHEFIYGNRTERGLRLAREEIARVRSQARASRELLRHEERSHAATKGHLTRTKKRVHAGVCPVDGCKRHFRDLERHLKSKHPGFKA